MKAGDTWVRSIFRGIESADFIVPLLSASALASPWVRKEIDTALLRTLGRGSSQCIVPVRIEPVEPPLELRSLQCIDFFADNAHGVCALIDRVRMPRRIESRPDAPGVGSQVSCAIVRVDRALSTLLADSAPCGTSDELWNLHRELLRLQAIVEAIAKLDPEDAKDVAGLPGGFSSNPIAGANEVARAGVLAISNHLGDASAGGQRARIGLATRYVQIIGSVIAALRASALAALPVRARPWRTS